MVLVGHDAGVSLTVSDGEAVLVAVLAWDGDGGEILAPPDKEQAAQLDGDQGATLTCQPSEEVGSAFVLLVDVVDLNALEAFGAGWGGTVALASTMLPTVSW